MTNQERSHCVECGQRNALVAFSNQAFEIEHQGMRGLVKGLSGWQCKSCKEVHFDDASAAAYAAAGDALVMNARAAVGAELRRVRKKLGLTQVHAAELTGGGHNAFSRYETGQAAPMPAVVNLFALLDRHPELLKELETA